MAITMTTQDSTFSLLWDLETLLKSRRQHPTADSYTAQLFDAGLVKVLDKLGEETTELMAAVSCSDKKHAVAEAADTIFHLLVLTVLMDISLEYVLPTHKKKADKNMHALIDMHKNDESFFYCALGQNLGELIYKFGKYDGSSKQYKCMSDSCRALFMCVLTLCSIAGISYKDIEMELEQRTSPKEMNRIKESYDVH